MLAKEDDPRIRVGVRVRGLLAFLGADKKGVDCISEKARRMNQSNDTTTKRKGLGGLDSFGKGIGLWKYEDNPRAWFEKK